MSVEEQVLLPTQKREPTITNPSLLVIYSHPKAGKTTLISKLDNCLIMDTEKGSKYLEALSVDVDSLETFNKIGKAIIEAKCPYKYIAIDTITEFENLLLTDALRRYKATPMGASFTGTDVRTLPNGAGYLYIRQSFEAYLAAMRRLAPHIILVGHLKDSMINKLGKEVSSKDLDLMGKLKQITCATADAIGYMYRDEENSLILNFKSKEEVTCGSRCPHLRGQEIKIAEYDPETNDLINVRWDAIYRE